MSDPVSKSLISAAAGAAVMFSYLRLTAKSAAPKKYVPPKVWKMQEGGNGNRFASINRPTAGARQQKDLAKGKHPLQLYSLATPNGVKVTIMLEELVDIMPEFEYDAWPINIMDGTQFDSGFVDVNPNSKIPALYDAEKDIRVFESGSILMYLAEKFPESKLLPGLDQPKERTEVINWVMWQMGAGPYLGGGFGHFFAYAPEKFQYPIDRFTMEAKRQLDVLNNQLADNKYIAGDFYSIADIAIWPWYGVLVQGSVYSGAETFLDVEQYPHVIRWANQLEREREAVRRGKMVNCLWGNSKNKNKALYAQIPPLPERHDRSDWAAAVLKAQAKEEEERKANSKL